MRVDDEMDAHAGAFCGAQIRLDLAGRIDDSSGRAPTAAEQVRDADGLLVPELTEDHDLAPLTLKG
jgi:hypothetical protein